MDFVKTCPDTTLYDDYAHRPFIGTNEKGVAEVHSALRQLPRKGNAVVGVSCFTVLNMAIHRGIPADELTIAVIDRGVRVRDFWQTILPMIQEIEDCDTFFEELKEVSICKGSTWCAGRPQNHQVGGDMIGFMRARRDSWLKNQSTYDKIREVVLNGRFFFFAGDIGKEEDALFVQSELAMQGAVVDLLYISNCHEYIPQEDALNCYMRSVGIIAGQSNPHVVTTAPRTCSDEVLKQRVIEFRSVEDLEQAWALNIPRFFFPFTESGMLCPVKTTPQAVAQRVEEVTDGNG